jgi:hypothetical protein
VAASTLQKLLDILMPVANFQKHWDDMVKANQAALANF